MCRRVLMALVSAAVLVGLLAQPGAAVNVPQAAVVSANPADWTPHVLDGKVDAIVQVGNKIVAGGLFTRVASAAAPATALPRSNIFAFDATTGAIDSRFAPALDGQVESLAVAPDGLHVFAGGSFTKINGVAQKSLVKLRLSDGAGITTFKGRTSARVKDMAISGGRLYIGGTFKTVNGVARTALAALDPVTGALSADLNPAFTGPRTGTVNVDKLDITPDGARLIAIGNWTYVAGLRRDQIVMLDLTTGPVTVGSWATTRYQQQCSASFDTYMRDHARRRRLARRQLVRGREHRRLPGRQPLRHRRPLGDRRHRPRPAADLGRLHRRRHPLQRRHHRDRGLRRRPPALDEQQLRQRQGRPRGGRPRGHRRPRPGQRPAAVLEPGTRPRRGRLRPGRHRPGPLDRQRHRAHRPLRAPRPHRLHAPGRRHRGPRVPGRHPAGRPVPPGPGRRHDPQPLRRRHRRPPVHGGHRHRLVDGPRRLRGQRPPLHRPGRRHHDRPQLRRGHRRPGHPGGPQRPDQHPVPGRPRHRHVLLERPPLLHPDRRPPPLLPLVHPPERHRRRRHLRRQRRRRRPQLVDRQRHNHGLRPPPVRHYRRHRVGRRLPRRPAHRHPHGAERPAVDGRSWESHALFVLN